MEDYNELKQAGFSDEEIKEHLRPQLMTAGFDEQEANQYFQDKSGVRPVSLAGSEQNEDIKQIAEKITEAKGFGKDLGVFDAIELGYQDSVIGMAKRGKMSEPLSEEQAQSLNLFERTAMGISSFVSDIPVYYVGGKAGGAAGAAGGALVGSVVPGVGTAAGAAVGGVVGSSAGAFALHSAARQTLIDMYTRGEVTSYDELMYRVKSSSKAAGEGALLGTATAGVGMATKVGMTAIGAGTKATAAAGYVGEVGTLTVGGSALEGEIPTAQDFIDNAFVIAGIKGVNKATTAGFNKISNDITKNLKKSYVEKGIHPAELVENAKTDPALLQELLAKPQKQLEQTIRFDGDIAFVKDKNGNFKRIPKDQLSKEMNFESRLSKDSPLYEFARDSVTIADFAKKVSEARRPFSELQQGEVVVVYPKGGAVKKTGEVLFIKPDEITLQVKLGENLYGQEKVKTSDYEAVSPNMVELGIAGSPQKYFDLVKYTEQTLVHTAPRMQNKPVVGENAISAADAVKISDVIKTFKDKFDVPIRTGKMGNKSKGVKGFYRINPEVIRTRVSNDITTTAHEVGHHLEKIVFGKIGSDEVTTFYNELGKIATIPSSQSKQMYSAEGFAEFISRYVAYPEEAKRVAPNFYEYFEKTMKEKSPDILNTLLETREAVDAWAKQPAAMEVLSHLSYSKDEVKPFSLDSKTAWNKFYTLAVDDLHPVKLIRDELTKGKISISQDPYIQARLFRGGWVGKATHFLEKATFDFKKYQNNGKSLKEIISEVENIDEFTAYLTARRSLELQERRIETGINKEASRATVAEFQPKYAKKAQELYDYQDKVLQYYRDSGMISNSTYLQIKAENKSYVPFSRVMDEDKSNLKAMGARNLKARQQVKKIKGSTRDIINPLESIIADTYKLVSMAERNYIGQTLANLTKFKGSGKYIEKIPTPVEKIKVPEKMKLVKEDGMGSLVLAGEEFFRKSNYIDKSNQIAIYRDGKQEIYQVTPELAKIVNGLGTKEISLLEKVLSFPSKTLRAGATLTPEFLVKNLFRDSLQAFITSESGFIPGKDSIKGLNAALKKTDTYWEWVKSGGGGSSMVSMDRTTLERNLSDLNKTGYKSRIWNKLNLLEDARILSELSEQSTRLGEFAKALEGKPFTRENLEKAGLASREVTLDFARAGSIGRALNTYTAFLNAGVQGTDKFFRTLKDKPTSALQLATYSLVIPTVLFTIANYGDEDIKEVPAIQREMNWVFKLNDVIYRIPKPQQWGFVFGTMTEKVTEKFLDSLNGQERDDLFEGLASSFFNEFQLNIVPTGVTPIVEHYANRNMFLDRPIIPADREKTLPEYQYTRYTNEVTKAVSKTLGGFVGRENTFSPAIAENYIKGWTGGLGNYLLELSDFALRKTGTIEDKNRVYRLEDSPFIRAFVVRHPSANAESIHKFREEYNRVVKFSNSFNAMRREQNLEEMMSLSEYKTFDAVKGINTTLNETMKVIRNIEDNPDIPVDEQRQTIDQLYWEMINISKFGSEIITDLNKVIE